MSETITTCDEIEIVSIFRLGEMRTRIASRFSISTNVVDRVLSKHGLIEENEEYSEVF